MEAEITRAAADSLSLLARHKEEAKGPVREALEEIEARLFDPTFEKPDPVPRRAFHQAVGFYPQDFVELLRTVIAARLLVDTELSHEDVAAAVGVKSAGSLWHFFLRFFGAPPDDVRRAGRAARRAGIEPRPTLQGFNEWRQGELGPEEVARMADRLDKVERHMGRPVRTVERPLMELSTEEDVLGHQVNILFKYPHDQRLRLLRRGVYLGSKEAFEALCRLSRKEGRRDRQRGVDVAEMALASIEGDLEDLGEQREELLALGWARLANARRVAWDLEGAEQDMERAQTWLEKAGEPQRARAELLGLKGSLRLFQQRFDEALECLDYAVADSHSVADDDLLVDALHQRAAVHLYRGEPAEALPDLDLARSLVPSHDLRRRMGSAQHSLAAAILAGENERAHRFLPEARRLSAEADHRASTLQVDWLEGQLLRQEGQLQAAEPILRRARAGFLEIRDAENAAGVSLELALLCHDQGGRDSEVRSLAAEALPALEGSSLPEAAESLALLRQAIDERQTPRRVLELARRRLLTPGA